MEQTSKKARMAIKYGKLKRDFRTRNSKRKGYYIVRKCRNGKGNGNKKCCTRI